MRKSLIVVPCYNEAARLDALGFQRLLSDSTVDLLFVDDGSQDATFQVLTAMTAEMKGRASVLPLKTNSGKAEAVRRGLLHGLSSGVDFVGYYDADLATPASEMLRLLSVLTESDAVVALASRVRLLGTRIERRPLRHYLGRIFATFSSLCLQLPVYDTQCGAKAFRCCALLNDALQNPFLARWAFDVELLGRLLVGSTDLPGLTPEQFLEMPLKSWRDVPGSKLRPLDFPKTLIELIQIRRALARRSHALRHSQVSIETQR